MAQGKDGALPRYRQGGIQSAWISRVRACIAAREPRRKGAARSSDMVRRVHYRHLVRQLPDCAPALASPARLPSLSILQIDANTCIAASVRFIIFLRLQGTRLAAR